LNNSHSKRFYEFGPFRLDVTERLLLCDGAMVTLTPKAFDTLLILIENSGRLVEKEELMKRLWPDTFVEEANLAHHVSVLRKTFEECANGDKYIQTVPRRGYRFIGDVKRVLDQSEALTLRPELESTDLSVDEKQPASAIDRQTAGTRTFNQIKLHKRAAALVILGMLAVAAVLLYARSRHNPASLKNLTFTQLTDQSGPEYFPSLSPDGKSVAYTAHVNGNWDIYLQRVGGKNPINLTKDSPANDTQPAFSPDGDRIAFRSDREGAGIFLMGATGENVKRLTDFGFNPAWSPDGNYIACADEGPTDVAFGWNTNSRVWIVSVATGEKRQVTRDDSIQPNWSPHGQRIAYEGRRNATQRDIFTIPAQGGEPVEVTNDPAMDANPVWSPDGKYLYFASDRSGSMSLWRIPIQEETGKVLGPPEAVSPPSAYSVQMSFSRDGKRMVYSQWLRGANLQQVAFDPVKGTITGQPIAVTKFSSRSVYSPDLSPDGEWLAFGSGGSKQENLFVIRRNGNDQHQLTDDSSKHRGARWSPDGRQIAFYSDRSGKWDVWMINADSSGLHQITYGTDPVIRPIWSPDGSRLAYSNTVGNPAIIEVGKSWQEQTPVMLPPMAGPGSRLGVYSWSPDGQKLALLLGPGINPNSSRGIVVYSFDTHQYDQVTDFGDWPAWLNDSRRLLFQLNSEIYLVDTQSKKTEKLLSVAPNLVGNGFALPRNNRLIYFSIVSAEADIWMMTLNE